VASSGLMPEDEAVDKRSGAGQTGRLAMEPVWRCGVCGYQRQVRLRPDQCPCGAPADRFEGRTAVEWRRLLI
jgi:rubrerythrin